MQSTAAIAVNHIHFYEEVRKVKDLPCSSSVKVLCPLSISRGERGREREREREREDLGGTNIVSGMKT